MNSKKLLAILLAATLLTGSLCGPVFAARTGRFSGTEIPEEIPSEMIITDRTDASGDPSDGFTASGDGMIPDETAAEEAGSAGEGSTAPEEIEADPVGAEGSSGEDASGLAEDAEAGETGEGSPEQFEEEAGELPAEDADIADEPAQQPEEEAGELPSEEEGFIEDAAGDSDQQSEQTVEEAGELPGEETAYGEEIADDSDQQYEQPEDSGEFPEEDAGELTEGEADCAEDSEDPGQQSEDDAGQLPAEEEMSPEGAVTEEESVLQPYEEAGQDLSAEEASEQTPPDTVPAEELTEDGLPEEADGTETLEEEAMADGALEGETVLADMTLQADMTIDGDAYLSSGFVDLNGYTLTINGSLVQPDGVMLINGGCLEVTGDYRIQYRNAEGEYSASNGVMAMHDETDYVRVEGNFYTGADSDYVNKEKERIYDTFTAGTFEIGEGFYQTESVEAAVRAGGTHRFLLKAGAAHTVSFANRDCRMAVLEAEAGADISWEGWFNVGQLGSDVTIHTADAEGDGIILRSENGRMDFYGHELTVEGNIRSIVGKLYIGGASLAGENVGDRPQSGGSLKVNGNIIQPEGAVVVDGGSLTVTGDYRIQYRNAEGKYSASNGVLAMHDDTDYVRVEGSFYTGADSDYVNKENERIYDTFTAGTFEIGEGFYQTESVEAAVRAGGTHRFLLKAGAAHTVSFANRDCRMAVLEAEAGADISWEGWFNVGQLGSDVTIHTADAEGEGILLRSENGRMDFYGHELTVEGNIRSIVGKLYIGGASLTGGENGGERPQSMGSLTVNGNIIQPEGAVVADGGSLTVTGDYRIQYRNAEGKYSASNGVLAMHDDTDYVKVEGSFYTGADSDYVNKENERIYDTFTAGTFEIGEGFYQTESGEAAVRADGTHRFMLKAGAAHTVSFANRDCRMAVLEAEAGADISWEGWFNVGQLGSDVTIKTADAEGDGILLRSENGRMDFYGHGLTVEGNIRSIVGKLYIGGASLAGGETGDRPQSMGSLTVNGNILQPEGAVVVDGGSLTVTGDYRIQYRNAEGKYSASNGVLAMHDDTDYVKVEGSFYTGADSDYVNKENERIYDTFTAGTFEIGGSFFQTESTERGFGATGTHKTILTGTGAQAVQFANADSRSRFQTLELTQDLSNYIFSRVPCWVTLICNGEEITEEVVAYTATVDQEAGTLTITSWKDDAAQIVIPDTLNGRTVTGIGKGAFKNRTALEEITLPATLVEIGESAFEGCTGLTAVTIPDGTRKLGNYAFYGCTALKKINMPASVTSMGEQVFRNTAFETAGPAGSGADYEFGWTTAIPARAFDYIQTLTEVSIPSTVTEIGDYAFYNCKLLTGIALPAGLTILGNSAFSECAALAGGVSLGALEQLGNSAFYNCQNLEEADFGENGTLAAIPANAFYNCKKLANIDLPDSLTSIGESAFRYCAAFTQVKVPAAVTVIDNNAFRDCTAMASLTFAEGSQLTSIGNSAFENDPNKLSALTEVTIPDGVTKLGAYAFYGCKGLKKVRMPAGVAEMGIQIFRNTALETAGPAGSGADYEFSWTSTIPAYGFDWIDTLTQITLPEGITTLGRNAIAECSSLTEITLPQSLTTLGEEVFSGCEGLQSIEFPEGVTNLPRNAMRRCISLTDVTLPDSLTTIGEYAFGRCDALTVLEISGGVTNLGYHAFYDCANLEQIIVPDSVTTIADQCFQKIDDTKPTLNVIVGSYAEEYAIAKGLNYEYATNLGHTVSARVTGKDGEALTTGYTVCWFAADTDQLLGTGAKLRNVEAGKQLLCSVILKEELGTVYQQPDDAAYTAANTNGTVEITLAAYGARAITGTVKDETGAAVPGASLQLKQIYNDIYEKTATAAADNSGAFTFDADKVKNVLTVSADGYYDESYTISESNNEDAVAIDAVLTKIPADKITLSLARMDAAAEGETPVVTGLRNFNGLTISAYNETQGRKVEGLRIQNPYLILSGNASNGAPAAGDRIRISITDTTGKLAPGEVTVTLDEHRCANASWTLVENGSVRFTGITLEDEEAAQATVMLFDAAGRSAQAGSADASYSTGALPAGTYTAVLMEKTSLLRSVDTYDKLGKLGLSAPADFAQMTVTVEEGVIAVRDGITVPDFDESRLYYTAAEDTRMWAGSSNAVTGQYVTMRAMYRIDDRHTTSGETVLLEIPAGMTFVEGSLTVNGKAGACTTEENDDGGLSVTVPVNTKKGTIRFYALPTTAGTKKFHSYLSFTNQNGEDGAQAVTQPVGTATVEVSAATISVPDETGYRQVTASGKTIANCDITVYDNGTAVGTTKSKKNGAWNLQFELVKPMKFSSHEIYAEVRSADYDVDIETDIAELLYNINYVEVSKVTMINTAHPDDSLRPTEFTTVFDFLHADTAVPTYNYWPSYPTFTFLVEFTGGDADVLSDVNVVTTDSSGEQTYVPCTYDETGKVWVGTHDYKSFSDVPCKVAVTCDNRSDEGYDDSMDGGEMAEMLAAATNVDRGIVSRLEQSTADANETFGDGTLSFDLTSNGQKIAEYEVEILDFQSFDLDAWDADNYVEFEDEDGSVSYKNYQLTDDSYTIRTVYPAKQLYAKETLRLASGGVTGTSAGGAYGFRPSQSRSAVLRDSVEDVTLRDWVEAYIRAAEASNIVDYLDAMAALYEMSSELTKEGLIEVTGQKEYEEVYKKFIGDWEGLKANAKTLKKHLDRMERVVNKKSCECLADSYMKKPLAEYKKRRDEYINASLVYACGAYAANGLMARASILGKIKASVFGSGNPNPNQKKIFDFFKREGVKKSIINIISMHTGIPDNTLETMNKLMGDSVDAMKTAYTTIDVRKNLARHFQELDREIRVKTEAWLQVECPCGKKCKCGHKEKEKEPEKKKEKEVVPKADPSGFVYEAVPSNRVEGATATIYQYTYAVDEFGMQDDERSEVLWDAENYDQVNPQATDLYGTFAWDVPEGSWVVKFTKDGYEDADSYADAAATSAGDNGKHYLPVPPIQTEVNTAMVSTAAPTVESVSAYEEEIRISFSQYMQINTVNTTNVIVTAAGGTAVAGTIEPLNAEDNYEGTAQYASAFAFRPAEAAGALSGTVTVSVNNVKNYSGKAITAAYSGRYAVTVMPKGLEITGESEMLHHDSMELTIRVLPAAAAAGRTLTITSYSPSIVSAGQQTVTTDENGTATVTLDGNLPGQGILEIALDGTEIAEEKQITVTARQPVPAIRSLEDGGGITLDEQTITYDGTEKEPAVTVSFNGNVLVEGTDYTVAYSGNINAGTDTAKVAVTGMGLYEGTIEQTFSIERAALASRDVTVAADGLIYNGKSQKPAVTVKRGGKKLASGKDYSVEYSNNVHAGTASVKVTGKGNYRGAVTKKFTIAKKDQSIKVTAAASKIAVGKSTTITVTGAKGTVTFKSASDSLATVKKKDSKTGTVKAVKVGKVRITVTAAKTSDFNALSKAVTISVVPAATTAFKADNLATGIRLTWKKVAGANAYHIYRGSTKITTVKNGSTVTFTDKKAGTNGTKYVYKIVASASSTGSSTLSKSVTIYRVDRPAVKSLTNSGSKKMTVKWGKNAKATGYQIQYCTDKTFKSGNKSVTISKASTVAKAITGLAKGKTYYVRIRTFKTAGSTKYFSAWSAVKSVKITK